jgi:uncharacterized protein YjbJ (UPF0337 family)
MNNTSMEDRAANVAGEAMATVGTIANDAVAHAEALARDATAAAGHVYDRARDQARGAAATVATSVEQQPLTSLLAVGIVCGAVGYLLGRR